MNYDNYSRNGTHVGQNLGAVTGWNHSISRIVQLFANEQYDYNYEKHEWDAAVGHYLQVNTVFSDVTSDFISRSFVI